MSPTSVTPVLSSLLRPLHDLFTTPTVLVTLPSPNSQQCAVCMSACSDLRPARWTMFTSHRDRKPQSVVSTGARDELCGKTSQALVRCSSELGQGHFLKSIRLSILSHPGVDMFPFHIIPLSAAHETALRLFMQYP